MIQHDVSLKLSDPMLQAARSVAASRDVTVGQVIRDALATELRRVRAGAKTPNRADEQLLVPLRSLLATDFATSRAWAELASRLKAKGYALREAGGGLALHSEPDGQRLCKASELGFSYAALMRQFGKPFPGHAHGYLATRIPAAATAR